MSEGSLVGPIRGAKSRKELKLTNAVLNGKLAVTKEQAEIDKMTQLLRREEIEKKLLEIELQDTVASILFMDIDHFKQVNDDYDHETGDELLTALTGRLKRQVKEGDAIGRWGGEEFIMILNGLSDKKVLEERAEKIRQSIKLYPFNLSKAKLEKTISIGCAVREEGEKWELLVDRADHALLDAKRTGRDKVIVAQFE